MCNAFRRQQRPRPRAVPVDHSCIWLELVGGLTDICVTWHDDAWSHTRVCIVDSGRREGSSVVSLGMSSTVSSYIHPQIRPRMCWWTREGPCLPGHGALCYDRLIWMSAYFMGQNGCKGLLPRYGDDVNHSYCFMTRLI